MLVLPPASNSLDEAAMDPTTTNAEERDQWRARINRALSELQAHSTHLHAAATSESDQESSSDPDNL